MKLPQLFGGAMTFVPPALLDSEWERQDEPEPEDDWRRQIGEVQYRPMLWTTDPPTRPGYWWVRRPGDKTEQLVVYVAPGYEYGPGLEWSSAPVPVPK